MPDDADAVESTVFGQVACGGSRVGREVGGCRSGRITGRSPDAAVVEAERRDAGECQRIRQNQERLVADDGLVAIL